MCSFYVTVKIHLLCREGQICLLSERQAIRIGKAVKAGPGQPQHIILFLQLCIQFLVEISFTINIAVELDIIMETGRMKGE